MGINFNRSKGISESYVGRFDKENPEDMAELEIVKQMIRWINKDVQEVLNYGTNGNFKKWRLEYKEDILSVPYHGNLSPTQVDTNLFKAPSILSKIPTTSAACSAKLYSIIVFRKIKFYVIYIHSFSR